MTDIGVTVPEGLTTFRATYPAAAWLVEDFENISRNQQLDRLVENFMRSGFKWTGVPTTDTTWLSAGASGEGDCGTIAGAFLIAAKALGFEPQPNHYKGPMYVANGGEVTGGGSGNIDGGPDWYFEDHHTVTVEGREFDLLFKGRVGSPQYKVGTDDKVDVGGTKIDRWTFGDMLLYGGKADDQANRYTKSWDKACEYAKVNKEWIASATAAPKKISSTDPIVQREGVTNIVKMTMMPEPILSWMVDYIMREVKFPISDDEPIRDILKNVTDDKFGDFDKTKYAEWVKQFG